MSLRTFKIGMGIFGGIIVIFAVALIAVALRGEDTRNIIEKSACSNDPASSECQRIKREADRERTLVDTCIAFRQAMTAEAFESDTRCPGREVVPQSSPSASQPPGPSGGSQDTPTVVPAQPSGPSRPSEPSTPSSPPEPPSEPTSPEPEPPAPSKPLIDLGPVTSPVCDLTRPLVNAC